MKEALSQIRHTKSDRPVFTPEFLARVKRVIVFNPLDRGAMEGIARKLVGEMQASWAAKRGKALEVPEPLVRAVAEEAHRLNQQSGGKEGGRVVRKLLSDWVEAPLQRAISERPAEYKACAAVILECDAPEPAVPGVAPAVSVRFSPPRAA
jgi:ATP-dependent Clp protease ATP-binding subunit ClpA